MSFFQFDGIHFILFGGERIIRWYGILITLGAILGAWLATRTAKRRGHDPEIVWDLLIYLMFGGIIGARIWHIFTPSPDILVRDPLTGALRRLRDQVQARRARQERETVVARAQAKTAKRAPPRIEPTAGPLQPSLRVDKERQVPLFEPSGEGGLPPLSLLDPAPTSQTPVSKSALEAMSRQVEVKLLDFGIEVQVVAVHPGPVVTRFELQPAPGLKVSRISALAKDLARSLSVVSVRIVEVIPGKSVVGLEIPNEHRELVGWKAGFIGQWGMAACMCVFAERDQLVYYTRFFHDDLVACTKGCCRFGIQAFKVSTQAADSFIFVMRLCQSGANNKSTKQSNKVSLSNEKHRCKRNQLADRA